MYKALNLHLFRNILPDLTYFLQGKLPCGHHPLCTQLPPEQICPIVSVIGLSGNMDLCLRPHFLGDGKHTGIGNDQCIRRGGLQIPQFPKIVFRTLQITIMRQNISRHIHLHPTLMGKGYPLRHFFHGKILGLRTQAKRLSAYINRIRSEDHCGLQYLQTAGRYQQFRLPL